VSPDPFGSAVGTSRGSKRRELYTPLKPASPSRSLLEWAQAGESEFEPTVTTIMQVTFRDPHGNFVEQHEFGCDAGQVDDMRAEVGNFICCMAADNLDCSIEVQVTEL
jgi:hypothetical protein